MLYIGYDYLFLPVHDKGNSYSEIGVNSIAVLPFNNYSEDKNEEYFSDGFTELIIANLAKINDLTVISRTSVMQYKNTTISLNPARLSSVTFIVSETFFVIMTALIFSIILFIKF